MRHLSLMCAVALINEQERVRSSAGAEPDWRLADAPEPPAPAAPITFDLDFDRGADDFTPHNGPNRAQRRARHHTWRTS